MVIEDVKSHSACGRCRCIISHTECVHMAVFINFTITVIINAITRCIIGDGRLKRCTAELAFNTRLGCNTGTLATGLLGGETLIYITITVLVDVIA